MLPAIQGFLSNLSSLFERSDSPEPEDAPPVTSSDEGDICIQHLFPHPPASSSDEGEVFTQNPNPLQKPLIPTARKAGISWPTPQVGFRDSVVASTNGVISKHGTTRIFLDTDLVEPKKIVFSYKPTKVLKTSDGKSVLQQQATLGSLVACAMMFRVDHGKEVKWDTMQHGYTEKEDSMQKFLTDVSLKEKITVFANETLTAQSLEKLRSLLLKSPAKITTRAWGAHSVILDAIDEKYTQVLVRDPYHGCQVLVKIDWLRRNFLGGSVLQVEKGKTLPRTSASCPGPICNLPKFIKN